MASCVWKTNEIKVSINDIMSEQLVENLSNEKDKEEYVMLDKEDGDFIDPTLVIEESAHFEEDADFAMALALQSEEDEKFYMKKAIKNDANAKIQFVLKSDYEKGLKGLGKKWNEEGMEDYEDEGDFVPSGDWYKMSDGSYKSKHDAEVCGRRNAKNLERCHDVSVGDKDTIVPNKAYNQFKEKMRRNRGKLGVNSGNVKKKTNDTREAVLDEKTRMILFKLLNRGSIEYVQGLYQVGKEGNVYIGCYENDNLEMLPCAIKIFRTTLTGFKNRAEYVVGDHRYDQGFAKLSNIRQSHIVAQKEFANLSRAKKAGIFAPNPICFKDHVLVMSFIGTAEFPAPRISDITLRSKDAMRCYVQLIASLRQLYQVAHLVHADFTAYNILYHDKKCWIVDFAQAVDVSHERSLQFLSHDATELNRYFKSKVATMMDTDHIVQYVTTKRIQDLEPHPMHQDLNTITFS